MNRRLLVSTVSLMLLTAGCAHNSQQTSQTATTSTAPTIEQAQRHADAATTAEANSDFFDGNAQQAIIVAQGKVALVMQQRALQPSDTALTSWLSRCRTSLDIAAWNYKAFHEKPDSRTKQELVMALGVLQTNVQSLQLASEKTETPSAR